MKLHTRKILFYLLFTMLTIHIVAWAQLPPGNISIAAASSNSYDIPPSQTYNIVRFDVTMSSLSNLVCYGYDLSYDDRATWSGVQLIQCYISGTYVVERAAELSRGTHIVHVRLRWWQNSSEQWYPAPLSSASTTFVLTKYYSVTVQNSFGVGNVKVDVGAGGGTYASGTSFTWAHGTNHTLEAIDGQTSGSYVQRFNVWSGPNIPNPSSLSIGISVSQNATYTANFKPEYNIAFQNNYPGYGSGGVINVNGQQYNSPTSSFPVVQGNTITGGVVNTYQVINGIEYTFSSWSPGGSTSASTQFTPGDHTTYTANFNAKPLPPPNVSAGGPVGNYVQVTWSTHPHPAVSGYQIWRIVKKQNQNQGPPTLLTSVGPSTTSITDYEFIVTSGYTNDLVWYDVRTVFNGTTSDPNFVPVFARQELARAPIDQTRKNTIAESLPTEYGVSAFPNPFNPSTTISYQLVENAMVKLEVFDVAGRKVASLLNEVRSPGSHLVTWNGKDSEGRQLSSGVYLYRFLATPLSGKEAFIRSGKLLMTK